MAVTIDFTGKTVLVTGAGRGIGKEVALAFATATANTPLGRPQTGWDNAMATLFLASDLARNITGQTLTIDGGKTMV